MGGSIAQFAALMRKLYQIYQFSYQLSTNIMWIYWITHLIWHDFILITTYNPSKKVKKRKCSFMTRLASFSDQAGGHPSLLCFDEKHGSFSCSQTKRKMSIIICCWADWWTYMALHHQHYLSDSSIRGKSEDLEKKCTFIQNRFHQS